MPKRKHNDPPPSDGERPEKEPDTYTVCMKLNSAWKPSFLQDHRDVLINTVAVATRLCHEMCLFWNGLVLYALERDRCPPPLDTHTVDQCLAAVIGKRDRKPVAVHRRPMPTPEQDQKVLEARANMAPAAAAPLTKGGKRKRRPQAAAATQKLAQTLTAAEEQARRDVHHQAQQLLCEFIPLWTRSGVDYRSIPASLYQQLGQTILANAKNSLFMPFFGRQMRVLQWQLFAPTDPNNERLRRWTQVTHIELNHAQERTRLRAHLQDRINGQGSDQPGDELFAEILAAHRSHALFRVGVISDALLMEQGPAVLQYYRYLLLQTEAAQAQRTAWLADPDYPHRSQLGTFHLRSFSLLPLRAYKPAHLPLTRTVMRSIFHLPKLELSDVVKEKWIKKGCFYLTSDGVACHLTLRRKRPIAPPRPLPFSDRQRGKFRDGDVPASATVPPVVGVDPGRDRLLQASNGYRLTKGQYYDECGSNTVRRRRMAYLKTLGPDELQAQAVLERLSFKAATWRRVNEQWQQLVPYLTAIFRIYGHRDLANDRFYRYRRKQQCLERMARELVAQEPPGTVIAFGNGQFPTSYRGAVWRSSCRDACGW